MNGVWYDPGAGPAPRKTEECEKIYSAGRKLAALRVRDQLKRFKVESATNVWSPDLPPTSAVKKQPPTGSADSSRISPTNPLRPRAHLPFKPDRSLSARDLPAPGKRIGRRSADGVSLPLDGVEGVGKPAPRSPKTNKASNRSGRSARTTTRATPGSSKGVKDAKVDANADRKVAGTADGTADGGSFSKAGKSEEMQRLRKLELTSAVLHDLARDFEQTASANEAVVGTMNTLPVVLGGVLMERADKKGSKEFFRELDVNGDGAVSKIEFKQMMRKLGLLGEGTQFNAAAVDGLFSELDADGGGELDLDEITNALKRLKARNVDVYKKEAAAKEEAERWRKRAEGMRAAAEQIGAKEAIANELTNLRHHPPADVRLAALMAQKQLKPDDLLAKLDTDKGGTVDQKEFAIGLRALGISATDEELNHLHADLDKVSRPMCFDARTQMICNRERFAHHCRSHALSPGNRIIRERSTVRRSRS